MEERNTVRDEAVTTKNEDKWRQYKILRNKCSARVKSDKSNNHKNIFKEIDENKDTKDLFKTMKNKLGFKTASGPDSFVINGNNINSPRELASHQLEFFQSKIKKLMDSLPPMTGDPCRFLAKALSRWKNKNSRPTFTLRNITVTETLGFLNKLGNSYTFGHDTIDSLALKVVASDIVLPLQKVINLSLTHKTFANKWKIANVIPLYKGKGLVKTSPASYRPISLLPVTAKIVEKAVQFQLLEFMEKSSQFNYNNHAYRNNLSTTTTMLHLSDLIFSATDSNLISVLMSVDESSAFDCVIHELLLRKLKLYNFDDSTCQWFQSYLTFRSQYVTIGAHKSNHCCSPIWSTTRIGPRTTTLHTVHKRTCGDYQRRQLL